MAAAGRIAMRLRHTLPSESQRKVKECNQRRAHLEVARLHDERGDPDIRSCTMAR